MEIENVVPEDGLDDEDVGLHRDKEDDVVQGGDGLVGEENVEKGFVFRVPVDEMGTRNRGGRGGSKRR